MFPYNPVGEWAAIYHIGGHVSDFAPFASPGKPKKLLDQVRDVKRLKQLQGRAHRGRVAGCAIRRMVSRSCFIDRTGQISSSTWLIIPGQKQLFHGGGLVALSQTFFVPYSARART